MKRCLVVGGSGALGTGICERLAASGARVAFTFRANEEKAGALAERLGAAAFHLDVRRFDEIDRVVGEASRALGGLDALVYAAAIGATQRPQGAAVPGRLGDVDEAGWDAVMDVNLKGAFFVAQRVVAAMLRNANGAGDARDGRGDIVFVGSIDGVKPVPTPIHYAASKAALDGMTRALAKALGPRIRVNTVHPGLLETGLSREVAPDLVAEYKKHTAQRRVGRVAEVAAVIANLVLENTYVTAQSIVVDGGL